MMSRRRLRSSFLLLFCSFAASEESKKCPTDEDGSCLNPLNECGIFMAPSTLGAETNMGIYTAKPLKYNETLNYPEIAIPLLFREWGEHVEGIDDGQLWDRYIWEGSTCDIESYTDTNREDSKAVFVPGVGCTINAVMDMHNIESTHGSIYDTAGLHRKKDPGSGAFCPYHSSRSVASTDIPAGAEIFAAYGEDWIPDIPGAQITLDHVMDKAEDFLKDDFLPFVEKHGEQMTDELKQGLWDFTAKDFPFYSQAYSVLPKGNDWKAVERELKELESSASMDAGEEANTDDDGSSFVKDSSSVIRRFIRKQAVRPVDWLHEKGYCQDHIKPGLSTIPQAGRGAFAARFLPAGTIIGYSPLIHIGLHGRRVYTIEYEQENREAFDLVINYSFGHRNSTVMLTPYGGMVNYINHNKERENVKVRWPNKELVAHKPDWLKKDPVALSNTIEKIGLSWEYVATKDIEEGEEVFMKYGEEWEKAWQEHVESWEPPANADNYLHSSEWPKDKPFLTQAEREEEPYSENLITMCQDSYRVDTDGTYKWVPVLRPSQRRVYCDVLERHEGEVDEGDEEGMSKYTYKIEMQPEGKKWVTVEGVPHNEVFLYDRAFSADWHLPNAFRHEIAIPDEIMPEAWLNGPPEEDYFEDEEEEDEEDEYEDEYEVDYTD